jgi:hypothetical protein
VVARLLMMDVTHRYRTHPYTALRRSPRCRRRRTDDGLFVFTRPNRTRIEENGAKCFRGNNSAPVQSAYRGFEHSLLNYLHKHDAKLMITPETSRCQWHGENMDYSQAIEAMYGLEQVAAAPEPLAG